MTRYKITSVFRETYETFIEAKDEDEALEIYYETNLESLPVDTECLDESIEVSEEVAA